MSEIAKGLIILGILFIVIGLLLATFPKISDGGRLPGDIFVRKENFSFYFPITTCVLLSLILNLFLNWFGRK